MPGPFDDLPPDFGDVLPPSQTPMPAPVQPPRMVSQDPRQQLLSIAALGALLGAGPRSGIGVGMGQGVLQAQQGLQQITDRHAAVVRQQQDQIAAAQQRAAQENEQRQRQLQSALMTITQRVHAVPDKETYDQEIAGYASALQGAGYRLDANWLRQAVPYVAPSSAKRAEKVLDAFLKNPANAQMIKENPDQLAKAMITFDVDGDGVPEQVPLLRLSQIAQMPFGVDESGQMLNYAKGTTLDDKANADGILQDLLKQAEAEGKNIKDPKVTMALREQAIRLATADKVREKDPAVTAQQEATLELTRQRLADARNKPKPQEGTLPPKIQQMVNNQSRAFDASPVVKRAQLAAEVTDFVNSLDVNTKNPADDMGLIYAYAKSQDPESAVREGEYASVQKYSQSVAQQFGVNIKRIGYEAPFLTPSARANLKATILSKQKASQRQYDNLRKSVAQRINRITGQQDGEDWLTDYGAVFPEDKPKYLSTDPNAGQPTRGRGSKP